MTADQAVKAQCSVEAATCTHAAGMMLLCAAQVAAATGVPFSAKAAWGLLMLMLLMLPGTWLLSLRLCL
jgi:hypothetical protein